MKCIRFLLLLLGFILPLSSCIKGKWPPIIVDKEELSFETSGGIQVVSIMKNYDGWEIYEIWDKDNDVNYFSAFDTRDKVEGNGITAVVDGKTLTITVSPTLSPSESRYWLIIMNAGDAYKSINVRQNK